MVNPKYIIIVITLIILFLILIRKISNFENKKEINQVFLPKRKYLLFSSIAKRDTKVQALDLWTKDKNRNFDIVLYYYNQQPPKKCFDYCIYKKGTKFPNFYHFMTNNDISNYEAIWIVDDDIKMETKNINRMFDIFKEYNLDLAQPSYTENSRISHPITKIDRNCKIRFSNFVENGVFICSQKMINKCKYVFKDSFTGFGIDFICCKMIDKKNNIAIIDETPCFHDDIKSSLNDVSKRSDHSKEAPKLYQKYNVKPYKKTIYKTLKK